VQSVKTAPRQIICVLAAVAALQVVASNAARAQQPAPSDKPENNRWEIITTGRVEPRSGEIKIAAPVLARAAAVPAKAGDMVQAGDLLVRLEDDEARARVASAQAQVALRKRVRNEVAAASRAAQRRKAEDGVSDAENAAFEARSALDQAIQRAAPAAIDAARAELARTQTRLAQQQADLRKLETQTNTPLPTEQEGELNVARAELRAAQAALEQTRIRAPIAGTVLKVNLRPGELAVPSTEQPLVMMGDLSALRVRAQVDEQDVAQIKLGQLVLVRTPAFPGKEFPGAVSSIAPIIELGDINLGSDRNAIMTHVAQVLVGLSAWGQLAVGMKVDVFFEGGTEQH
jgi:HlyD family secretion protein